MKSMISDLMKSTTYVDVLRCSEAFSEHQNGKFPLQDKGLRGLFLMF